MVRQRQSGEIKIATVDGEPGRGNGSRPSSRRTARRPLAASPAARFSRRARGPSFKKSRARLAGGAPAAGHATKSGCTHRTCVWRRPPAARRGFRRRRHARAVDPAGLDGRRLPRRSLRRLSVESGVRQSAVRFRQGARIGRTRAVSRWLVAGGVVQPGACARRARSSTTGVRQLARLHRQERR